MRELTGVICANVTPFTTNTGLIDEAWLPAHLRFLEQQGVSGVLALGTTGEGPSLSLQEREQVLDMIVAQRGNLFVMAGTGCAALPETVALSRYALQRGADAVLVMPPFYFKNLDDAGVLAYYRALCDVLPSDARVLLYHIPAVTAVPITPGIIEGLLQSHPQQFYGIKDSSGDEHYLSAVLANYPQLRVYVGSALTAAHGLQNGAAGLISAISNTWPRMVVDVVKAHQEGGDVGVAQAKLTALSQAIGPNTPPALKAALPWVSDLPHTSVRVPLCNLSDVEVQRLKAALEKLNVI
jgi:4-hydroxy-tetrahydrodipicolinate synthase